MQSALSISGTFWAWISFVVVKVTDANDILFVTKGAWLVHQAHLPKSLVMLYIHPFATKAERSQDRFEKLCSDIVVWKDSKEQNSSFICQSSKIESFISVTIKLEKSSFQSSGELLLAMAAFPNLMFL